MVAYNIALMVQQQTAADTSATPHETLIVLLHTLQPTTYTHGLAQQHECIVHTYFKRSDETHTPTLTHNTLQSTLSKDPVIILDIN